MPQAYVTHLDDNARGAMVDLLNARLAEAVDLSAALKQAHWNVKGTSFIGFHELLDDVTERMRENTDTIAERAVILGGYAHGTVQVAAKNTKLDPFPTELADIDKTAIAVRDRLMAFGGRIREGIDAASEAGDEDTADLFTEVSRVVDKDAWFVGAHAEQTS